MGEGSVVSERARLALVALWAVPGLGPKALERLAAALPGFPESLLDLRVTEWIGAVQLSEP